MEVVPNKTALASFVYDENHVDRGEEYLHCYSPAPDVHGSETEDFTNHHVDGQPLTVAATVFDLPSTGDRTHADDAEIPLTEQPAQAAHIVTETMVRADQLVPPAEDTADVSVAPLGNEGYVLFSVEVVPNKTASAPFVYDENHVAQGEEYLLCYSPAPDRLLCVHGSETEDFTKHDSDYEERALRRLFYTDSAASVLSKSITASTRETHALPAVFCHTSRRLSLSERTGLQTSRKAKASAASCHSRAPSLPQASARGVEVRGARAAGPHCLRLSAQTQTAMCAERAYSETVLFYRTAIHAARISSYSRGYYYASNHTARLG